MTRSELFCPYGNIDCGDPGSPYMAQCQFCDADDAISKLREKIAELYEEINDLRQQIVTLSIPKQARK